VRQPRRSQFLCGKFLALAAFIGLAVVLEIVVSSAVAFALAPGRGISTGAWTSSTGINDMLQATLHVFLASVGFGMIGAAAGVWLRSPGVAIGAAVAYVVAIEGIIVAAVWSNGDRWLPGQLLSALARGGSSTKVAVVLQRSVNTVNVHVKSVMRKLGCATRYDAIAIAREHGLVD